MKALEKIKEDYFIHLCKENKAVGNLEQFRNCFWPEMDDMELLFQTGNTIKIEYRDEYYYSLKWWNSLSYHERLELTDVPAYLKSIE